MPSRYDEENVLTVPPGLKILRAIVNSDEGSYSAEIEDKKNIPRTDASTILQTLYRMDVIQQGKRTRAQYYEVNPEGLEQLFCSIWEIDQEDTQDKFQEFLLNWTQAYDKGDSSIRRMLREDFAEAINEYRRDNNDEYPEGLEFLDKIGKMKGYLPVKAYLDKALRKTSDEDNQ